MRTPRTASAMMLAGFPYLVGCGGEAGALGNAAFSANCSSEDPSCRQVGLSAPLAVGARVDLNVDTALAGSGATSLLLASIRPDVLALDGTTLHGIAPGVASVLVSADSLVIDFVHVWVAEPTGLAIHQVDAAGVEAGALAGTVELLPGDELNLLARPEASAQPLLGSNDPQWSVEGDSVTLLRQGESALRRLVARQPGAARLAVDDVGFTTELAIEVLP